MNLSIGTCPPPDEAVLRLRDELALHPPEIAADAPDCPRASVALIVRPGGTGLELLLIRRAERSGDPWSGHMALPGGREDPGDPDPLFTAVRETREEVGIELDGGTVLGRLDDVRPVSGAPRIAVSAWVFAVSRHTATRTNHEVDLAIWVPLPELLDPGASREYLYSMAGGETLAFPALGYQDHVIWGLTHRILAQFLEIARRAAGSGETR